MNQHQRISTSSTGCDFRFLLARPRMAQPGLQLRLRHVRATTARAGAGGPGLRVSWLLGAQGTARLNKK